MLGDSHHLASDLVSYRGCIPNTISRVVLLRGLQLEWDTLILLVMVGRIQP